VHSHCVRNNTECARLSLAQGGLLQWVSQYRYLGVYVLSGRTFRCSYDHNKCQFFKAFNAIVLQSWTLCLCHKTEVVLNLLRTKCLPVLLYGVEESSLLLRDRKSLDFTITCSFMKLFRTGSVTVVTDCQKF